MNSSDALLPFKYKIPFAPRFVEGAWHLEAEYVASSPSRRRIYAAALDSAREGLDNRWATFSDDVIAFLAQRNDTPPIREGWTLFAAALDAPAIAYTRIVGSLDDAASAHGIPLTFMEVVNEVLRQGPPEGPTLGFLMEKRLEYDVSESQLNEILRDRARRHPAFTRIVDEVMRDGILTTAEQEYVATKAREFGIRTKSDIDWALKLAWNVKRWRDGKTVPATLKTLMGAMCAARYLLGGGQLERDLLKQVEHQLAPSDQTEESRELCVLESSMEQQLQRLSGSSSLGLGTFQDIVAALRDLRHDTDSSSAAADDRKSTPFAKPLLAGGLIFNISIVQDKHGLLFDHTVRGQDVEVNINLGHPFLEDAGESEISLVARLALSQTMTQLQMYGDEQVLDQFFVSQRHNDLAIHHLWNRER